MKRRVFFRSLAVSPLTMAAFVREPDKLTEREFDEFLKLAMRYQNPKKPKLSYDGPHFQKVLPKLMAYPVRYIRTNKV